MAALKEIKSRIASVGNTLKITSAMKMVASAKLHRTQAAALALSEYERQLSAITSALCSDPELVATSPLIAPHKQVRHAVVVAFSSDGSLAGSFNANAIREMIQQVEELRKEGFSEITVYPVGEKIAVAAHKTGYSTNDEFRQMAGKPSYEQAAALADRLMGLYASGKADRVSLVYNHFQSMGQQIPRQEVYLPAEFADVGIDAAEDIRADYIYEPSAPELLEELLPYTLRTQLYEVLLDSGTAEHAARMVAMQTATDNARELIEELSLSYNKQRQQAITDELADITVSD